jgi:hypothetical protein
VLHVLTNPLVVNASQAPPNWNVLSLLQLIAQQEFGALIDTGALITGMDNEQVARYLLQAGLEGKDGCVFLDRYDRQMVILRGSEHTPVSLKQAGIPSDRRFTFYDQVPCLLS